VRKLCFEVTESTAITNLREATEFVARMRGMGVRIALDDVAVRSFHDVASVIGVKTVAEFVDIGIDYGQGFALHRREPLEDLVARVATVG
jgi:EAL domain-containing protein (putative c-di-GMP-specific phosphodiesterase class I)